MVNRTPLYERLLKGVPSGRQWSAAELISWVKKRHPRVSRRSAYAAISHGFVRGLLRRDRLSPFGRGYVYRSPA